MFQPKNSSNWAMHSIFHTSTQKCDHGYSRLHESIGCTDGPENGAVVCLISFARLTCKSWERFKKKQGKKKNIEILSTNLTELQILMPHQRKKKTLRNVQSIFRNCRLEYPREILAKKIFIIGQSSCFV